MPNARHTPNARHVPNARHTPNARHMPNARHVPYARHMLCYWHSERISIGISISVFEKLSYQRGIFYQNACIIKLLVV